MKDDFLKYQAQTTPHPLGMEVSHAEGSYIYDTKGTKYLDFVAGVSANSLGHRHPKVVSAIKKQLDTYMHVMVYGEYAQDTAVQLTKLLAEQLPDPLDTTYLVNSGAEAIDGSIKLARRATGRTEIIYAHNAYHGNTFGALSIMGYDERKQPFEPLLPDCHPLRFNYEDDLQKITKKTAAVVLETIQGGAGFILPKNDYLKKVRNRCDEVGALLILDEIQPGFGRTGKLFGFEHFDVVPDIVVMGKGMGGGMPIGAFTASNEMMSLLKDNPKLGHITTFGGHPVIAAAALATLKEITETNLMEEALRKEARIRQQLQHPLIHDIRGKGLMLAAIVKDGDLASEIILQCQEKGLILFWLLFEPRAIRITPPITVSDAEIDEGCQIILDVCQSLQKKQKHNN
ncbi:aspartate aminotransferase family protein [Luteirhabdus pelagi]|uniref:aspartate aminotransferase family protein n=1 Tax=Luteirhabdus pelagi TaxID=2792783 RepID=UPI00193969DC|nr:aspartate aminotransferase family protein [Luteirhabdus pelagi]